MHVKFIQSCQYTCQPHQPSQKKKPNLFLNVLFFFVKGIWHRLIPTRKSQSIYDWIHWSFSMEKSWHEDIVNRKFMLEMYSCVISTCMIQKFTNAFNQ